MTLTNIQTFKINVLNLLLQGQRLRNGLLVNSTDAQDALNKINPLLSVSITNDVDGWVAEQYVSLQAPLQNYITMAFNSIWYSYCGSSDSCSFSITPDISSQQLLVGYQMLEDACTGMIELISVVSP
jgi:hypothetical protein